MRPSSFEAMPRSAIDGFVEERFTAAGSTRSIFRCGEGPVVVLMHELPGLTPQTIAFATELACHGFEIVLPLLFGLPKQSAGEGAFRSIGLCVRKKFHCLGSGRSSGIVDWLRPLCRALHARAAGPGIGVIGMCFSGGFVLSMMLEPSVLAPVSAQPALPLWPRGALDISDGDLKAVLDLPIAKPLLLLRFDEDRLSSSARLKTIKAAFDDKGLLETCIAPGKGHSTLVYDYDAAKARHCDPRAAVVRHLTSLLKP